MESATGVRSGTLRTALVIAAVLAGVFLGAGVAVSILELFLTGPAPVYAGYKQRSVLAYGILLPVLGLACLVTSLLVAFLGRRTPAVARPAVVAAAAVVASMVLTLVVHAPLNAEIMSWTIAAPPADWEQVRDSWSTGQTVRLVLSTAAVLALAGALLSRRTADARPAVPRGERVVS